ncbi:MAG: hypothetical protein ACRDSF_00020 [Pseudonocardiaceae bacterium]
MRVIDLRGRGWEISRVGEKEIFKVDLTNGSIFMGGMLLFFWLLLIVVMPEDGIPIIHILPWWVKAALVILMIQQKRWGWLGITILLSIPWTILKVLLFSAPLWFILLGFGSRSWSITAKCDDGEEWEGHVKGYRNSWRILRSIEDNLKEWGMPEKSPKVLVRVDS